MIFNQHKDGSCDLLFSKEEIEVLNKYKKLSMTPEFFKHFSNILVKMAITFNDNFDEKTKRLMTIESMDIKIKDPK